MTTMKTLPKTTTGSAPTSVPEGRADVKSLLSVVKSENSFGLYGPRTVTPRATPNHRLSCGDQMRTMCRLVLPLIALLVCCR